MKKGFTLVELLAVVVIIGVVSILVMPRILERFEIKKDEVSEEAKELIYMATGNYLQNNPNNESACITISQLVDEGYLISPVLDVKTQSPISDTAGVEIKYKNNQYNYNFVDSCP